MTLISVTSGHPDSGWIRGGSHAVDIYINVATTLWSSAGKSVIIGTNCPEVSKYQHSFLNPSLQDRQLFSPFIPLCQRLPFIPCQQPLLILAHVTTLALLKNCLYIGFIFFRLLAAGDVVQRLIQCPKQHRIRFPKVYIPMQITSVMGRIHLMQRRCPTIGRTFGQDCGPRFWAPPGH